MITFSQNKKIAIYAISIFIVSFSALVFFLGKNVGNTPHGQASVVGHGESSGHGATATEETAEEPLYAEFITDLEEPFVVTNEEGVIQYANEEFCESLDLDCEEILEDGSVSLFDFVNAKDLGEFAAAHSKIVHDGENIDGIGPYRMLKDDEEVLFLLSAKPVLDEEEKVAFIILTAKDLTDKVTEMQEEEKNEEENEPEKVDDKKEDNAPSEEVESTGDWIKNLYPKIREIDDGEDNRFMVNTKV